MAAQSANVLFYSKDPPGPPMKYGSEFKSRTPLSFTQARHTLPFYALRAGHPGLTAVSGVASHEGRRPAAVFYPFGHPHAVRLW
jgi:hypothetical protein